MLKFIHTGKDSLTSDMSKSFTFFFFFFFKPPNSNDRSEKTNTGISNWNNGNRTFHTNINPRYMCCTVN